MAIEYRLMQAEEMEQILDFWVEIYLGTERESWKRELMWRLRPSLKIIRSQALLPASDSSHMSAGEV